MLQTVEEIIEPNDFLQAYKFLRVAAKRLTRDLNQTFDCGISMDDLVHDVMCDILRTHDLKGWDRQKGKLESFLHTLLKRKFIDHLRRQKFVANLNEEDMQNVPNKEPVKNLAPTRVKENLFRLIQGRKDESELVDLIEAAECIEEGGNKNQQMAELLDVSIGEIERRKKRLVRVAKQRGLV